MIPSCGRSVPVPKCPKVDPGGMNIAHVERGFCLSRLHVRWFLPHPSDQSSVRIIIRREETNKGFLGFRFVLPDTDLVPLNNNSPNIQIDIQRLRSQFFCPNGRTVLLSSTITSLRHSFAHRTTRISTPFSPRVFLF